jgi:hypothetical protein
VFVLATVLVPSVYLWSLRNPYLGLDLGSEIIARLRDPQTPVEKVRGTAIEFHELVLSETRLVNAAMHTCIALSAAAAIARSST